MHRLHETNSIRFDYSGTEDYSAKYAMIDLDIISKVILDNKGVILDRNFDQNITLKIRVSASTKELIEKKFPTAKIQSLV